MNNWPNQIGDKAKIGIVGEFLAQVEPLTEASLESILIQALAAFSNVIGPIPHIKVEETKHPLNLFTVIVGKSSKGRKGTSWGHVRNLFKSVDEDWSQNRIVNGVSTGEGLIWSVRDDIEEGEEDIRTSKKDKRLLVVEPEFASLIKHIGREGNILSPVIRNAWDGDKLQVLTKNSPISANRAHICIIGHITIHELLKFMKSTEYANGFGNRFLWVMSQRTKLLPIAPTIKTEVLSYYVNYFYDAVEFSKTVHEITFSSEGEKEWEVIYGNLSRNYDGIMDSITSRAEPQVLRIAGLYALLEKKDKIAVHHLLAANEVWRYCEDSCKYIFGDNSGDEFADKLFEAINNNPFGFTRTQIHLHFSKGKKAQEIQDALDLLSRQDKIYPLVKMQGQAKTEYWYSKKSNSSNSTNSNPYT